MPSIHPIRVFLLFTVLGLSIRSAVSQETAPRKWLTGDPLTKQLDSKFGIAWSSEPLRQKLSKLSDYTQVAVWLDRRIDPSQQPELSIEEVPLARCFELIGERVNASVCRVGPVVYLGPANATAKLATLAELRGLEAANLPADARARLTRSQAWTWDALTSPQELLAALAQDGKVQFLGAEKIPHDLWATTNLPALTFTDRLSLLLAGFDLTFKFDATGKTIQIVPMPDQPTIVRKYSVKGDIDQALSVLRTAVPKATLTREGPRIVATGRTEDHQAIAQVVSGERARAVATGPARTGYTMRGPSMLGTVLKTLQVKAGLNISVDDKAQGKLKDRLTFDVQDASLEELLTAVLRNTGLQFELNGKDLRVFAP